MVYQSLGDLDGIPHAHYEICTDEKEPKNITCLDWIVGDKFSQKIIKQMITLWNEKYGE